MRKRILLKHINDEHEKHIEKGQVAMAAGDSNQFHFELGAATALGSLRMWIKLGYLDTKHIEKQKKEQHEEANRSIADSGQLPE